MPVAKKNTHYLVRRIIEGRKRVLSLGAKRTAVVMAGAPRKTVVVKSNNSGETLRDSKYGVVSAKLIAAQLKSIDCDIKKYSRILAKDENNYRKLELDYIEWESRDAFYDNLIANLLDEEATFVAESNNIQGELLALAASGELSTELLEKQIALSMKYDELNKRMLINKKEQVKAHKQKSAHAFFKPVNVVPLEEAITKVVDSDYNNDMLFRTFKPEDRPDSGEDFDLKIKETPKITDELIASILGPQAIKPLKISTKTTVADIDPSKFDPAADIEIPSSIDTSNMSPSEIGELKQQLRDEEARKQKKKVIL